MNDFLRKEMQERNLGFIVENSGLQFTNTFFPYTSGEIGNYYVHSECIQHNSAHYQQALNDLLGVVCHNLKNKAVDFISGGERRDWIFSLHIAPMYRRPHLSIYKDKTTSGFDINGKLGAHVADLNNEGSSPRDLWVPAIQNQRGRIEDIFFYVDRCEDGLKVMDSLRLNHDSVVHLNRDAWEYLHKNGTITREIYVSLRERLENKDAWARRMLRSEDGIRTLKELLVNPKTTGKAKKIIFVTYSDMIEEIADRLHKQENFSLHEMLAMAE